MSTSIAVNIALIVALVAWLVSRLWPPTEAVRLRNALLVERGEPHDFEWTPERVPRGFLQEQHAPEPIFVDVVKALHVERNGEDWQRALKLSVHLVEHAQERGAVRADLMQSYRAIRNGFGYCADFVRVYLGLAHAAGLPTRQWGFSFDGFGGHGHTFVEVFDRQRQRWLFLDVYNNFHFVDAKTREPLGALEARAALRASGAEIAIVANGPGRPGFVFEAKAREYYQRGIGEWYLFWGNAVVSYYAHPLVKLAGRFSATLANLAATAVGVQARIRIFATPENAAAVRRIYALRRSVAVAAGAALLLAAALVVQLQLHAAT